MTRWTRTILMALRSLRARPSRTALTLLGIILGVAVILAISITNLSTLDSLTSVFSEAAGDADLVVLPATDDEVGFSERARGAVLSVAGVQAAIPSLHATALLDVGLMSGAIQPGREANFFGGVESALVLWGIDPTLDPQVRDYTVVAGEFLPPVLDAYEVVLVEDYAAGQDIAVGSDVGILTPTGIKVLRVVGLIAREGAGRTNNGLFGVMPLQAAQQIFCRSSDLDQIDVVATPQTSGAEALEGLRTAIEERLGGAYNVTYPAAQGRRVVQMLDVYQIGLSFFSAIAIFVGAFLIYNAFAMTVVERTREFGMLRAVGMTRGQVVRQVLVEAGFLGVLGSMAGVGAGILLSRGLIRLMELLLGQEVRTVRIPQDGLLISVGVGLGVTLAAAALPALAAGRISPLEAMRIRAGSGESWAERRGWPVGLALLCLAIPGFFIPVPEALRFWVNNVAVVALSLGASFLIPVLVGPSERTMRPLLRPLFGSEGRLGAGNIQRAKQRTTLTVMALMVGIAMLFSIQALTVSFERDIQAWISGYIGGDLYVYSSQPMRTDLSSRLEAIDGVEAVTPMRRFDVTVLPGPASAASSVGEVESQRFDGEETLAFMAVDPLSYERVTSFVFGTNQGDPQLLMARLAEGDAVFVSTVVADRYGLEQGDTIRLQTRRGQHDFFVAAIVVDFWDRGLVIEGSWKDMRRYFRLNDVSAFQVKVRPGYAASDVQARIEELYGSRRHLTIESNETMKAQALSVTNQAFSMFDVLALIAVVVAALGVVNTLTMNVMERTQEIGMLRGVGMTRWQVVKMILAEAAMLGIMGGVLGVLFGLFQSRLFILGANQTQGYELGFALPWEGLVIGFAIALVVSQVAAAWPAQRAARLRIIEAIQYE